MSVKFRPVPVHGVKVREGVTWAWWPENRVPHKNLVDANGFICLCVHTSFYANYLNYLAFLPSFVHFDVANFRRYFLLMAFSGPSVCYRHQIALLQLLSEILFVICH